MIVSFVSKEKQRAEENFVGLTGGTLEERAKTFTKERNNQIECLSVLRFAYAQKERVEREISPVTLNYFKQ